MRVQAPEASPARGLARSGGTPKSFVQALETARRKPDELKTAAAQLVSSAFVLPILASLHDSPLRPAQGPFAAGAAEKRFSPLLQQRLADNVVQAANFKLVDIIVNQFSEHVEITHGRE